MLNRQKQEVQTFQLNHDLLVESRLPKKFWSLKETTFPGDQELLKAVVRYTKQTPLGGNLMFHGPSKSGKTFLISCILRRCLLRSVTCAYYRMQEITDIYYSEHNTGRVNMLQTPQLLALDNVCVPNRGERASLLRLLRFREDENLPTLLGSELAPAEVELHFGSEVKDHLDLHFLGIKTSLEKTLVQAQLSSELEKRRSDLFPPVKIEEDI